jgi:hypothetical protein
MELITGLSISIVLKGGLVRRKFHGRPDTQLKNSQHNDTEQNNTQHNDTHSYDTLTIVIINGTQYTY